MARLVGLDIGSTSIKVVELEQGGKTGKLVTAGLSVTPPKGLLSEASFDQMAVAQAIQKTSSDAKISTKSVNISLPENSVFTRVVEMPYLTEKELSSAIRWEAEQYIPLPLSEVILDYQILGQETGGKTGKMAVFLAASPKTLVGKYERIIAMAGLSLVSIETEALALNRALIDEGAASPMTLVIGIGSEHTTVVISKGGSIVLTYVIHTGGKALTRALASDLGMDQAQAEEYKKTYGLEKDVLSGKISNSVRPLLDNLVAEVKRVINFYQGKSSDTEAIRRVVLVGGGAKLPGLVVFLTETLGIETQIGDPWQKVTGVQKLAGLAFDPILFAEAVGLALKPLSP